MRYWPTHLIFAPFIKLFFGADEFINAGERYCLWLKNTSPQLVRSCELVKSRIEGVKSFREQSTRQATRELAATPTLFAFVSHTDKPYLMVPSVSSERRSFVPIGFMSPEVIGSNLCLVVPSATLFHFGILTSNMHNAWMRTVSGRLKSDYRYSVSIVYNNFPWPEPNDKQRAAIEAAAQGVLDARASHPGASLADLYDPLTMPPDLVKAHQQLDKAVDSAYAFKGGNDAARVAFLFALYQQLTSLLPPQKPKGRPRDKSAEIVD